MRKELPKVYEPQDVESRIYNAWMENDCFKADPDPKKKPFLQEILPKSTHISRFFYKISRLYTEIHCLCTILS